MHSEANPNAREKTYPFAISSPNLITYFILQTHSEANFSAVEKEYPIGRRFMIRTLF